MTLQTLTAVAETSVRRRVLGLAGPAVLEQLLNMSVGLADTYIVGHLGAAPLAAVGLCVQSLNLFWALLSAIGVGSTVLVARRIGAQRFQEANVAAQQSIFLALWIGIVFTVVLWVGAPYFLDWLGAEAKVIELGSGYMRAVASTVFMLSVLLVGSAIMRGAGDTRTPMLVMLVINVVNVIVTYGLVYGVGPLPNLGVLGSGIGAATARGLGGLLILGLLVRGRGHVKIGLKFPRPDWDVIQKILRISLPTAGEQLLMRVGQLLLTMFITQLGTVAVAAHQVAINALSLAYMPGWGFALAATTLVGQELGARQPERAVQSGFEAVRMASLIMAVLGVLISIFPGQVMTMLTDDPAVIDAGVPALRIAGLSMPFLGASFTLSGGLRGAGDTLAVMAIISGCIWGLRVANGYWLGPRMGLAGIWLAIGMDFVGRSVFLGVRFYQGRWKHVQV